MPRIALLPGDGIGPELAGAAVLALDALGDFEIAEHAIGGASIDEFGTALTDETLEACRESDAVLLCAVGGPKWDTTDPDKPRPEQGLLGLRKGLGLFANLRPVRPSEALLDASPLRRDRIEGTDLLVVRELTGGIYFGDSGRDGDRAHDDCAYTVEEIELDHLLVDNAAMQLVSRPADFDVIVTENLFGDILSDEAAMLTGSLGMLPSASLGEGGPGLYEPVHGSAPDIAGTGKANPLATLLSVAMMLKYGLGMHEEAARLETAVDAALARDLRTPDLGGNATTEQATRAVLDHLQEG